MLCISVFEVVTLIIFKLHYIFCPPSHHTGKFHDCIYLRLLSPSHVTLPSAEPSPELVKEWEECVWRWESIADSSIHPFNGPHNSWRQQEWSRRKESIIIGAAGTMCPVPRADKWCCEIGTAGRRCPQLLLAYEAPPDHHQPPSVSWQWAKQPGNHLLLKWWLPASVALPKRWKSWFRCFSYSLKPKETMHTCWACRYMTMMVWVMI